MAIEVTEDPYKQTASLRDPWRAYREFIVTGTSDPSAALTAVDGTSGVAVAQVDEPWVAGSSLKCTGPEIKSHDGMEFWRIGCEYIVPTGGSANNNDPNPLLQKPRVSWSVLRMSNSVDVDLDGRPITDTAGSPLAGLSRDMGGFSFNIIRNEPFFNIVKSHAFSMCVNDRDVVVDRVTFKKWRLLLDYIIPVGDYQFGAAYVTIGYQFHYLPADVLGDHPWQHRVLNAGDEGWYESATVVSGTNQKCKGKFTNEDGNVVNGVRLDLTGKPMTFTGVSFKVGTKAAIANPVPVATTMKSGNGAPITAYEELREGANLVGYALLFKKVQIKDLSPILFG